MGTLYQRVTSDQLVSRTPIWIYSLVITSNGTAEADATIYDGESTSGDAVLTLYTVDESMAQLVFPEPLYLHKGLYVDIGSNVTEVLVQYVTRRE